jgi:hypothetical protein
MRNTEDLRRRQEIKRRVAQLREKGLLPGQAEEQAINYAQGKAMEARAALNGQPAPYSPPFPWIRLTDQQKTEQYLQVIFYEAKAEYLRKWRFIHIYGQGGE